MTNAEEWLEEGDKEKDIDKQTNYYNSAVDKYKEAYQIIMNNITIDQINIHKLKKTIQFPILMY